MVGRNGKGGEEEAEEGKFGTGEKTRVRQHCLSLGRGDEALNNTEGGNTLPRRRLSKKGEEMLDREGRKKEGVT